MSKPLRIATTGGGAVPAYIEDVFSTWLYTGNGSTQTITNGIDLAGKGGLVWIKSRSAETNNFLFDTNRGALLEINSNTTDAQASLANSLTTFNADGFSLGSAAGINVNAATYASWNFRKQPKFFDVVTWTGNGANRTIAHNLGSVPGCIIVKRTDTAGAWQVYHRSLANTQYMVLNTTAAVATGATRWNSTTPTSTVFSLGTDATVNASGGTYVAYVYAHNAGGFGLTGTDNVISCGSYTASGAGTVVNLGYEPQWVMVKSSSAVGGWYLLDNMRGMALSGFLSYLDAASSGVEPGFGSTSSLTASATGFIDQGSFGTDGRTMTYIAIRRGPMKVPTDGTKVFTAITKTADAPTATYSEIGFPFDTVFNSAVGGSFGGNSSYANRLSSRLTGLGTASSPATITSSTNAEAAYSYSLWNGQTFSVSSGWSATKFLWYFMLRAPNFFDVVCYTGTGANRTVAHNLAAVPELMIVKGRSGTTAWQVYSSALVNTEYLVLNTTAAKATGATRWNSTTPTNTVFSLGTASEVNTSAATYVAYLFASCPGVSKVGSFTGTGTTQVIDCGFTGGARFVLIKATSTTGDWYVWDTARGIVAGNDPYLLLNSTAAEVTTTDWVDTAATGFELSNAGGNLANSNGVSYIFLAIA